MFSKIYDSLRGSHHNQVFQNWYEVERQLLRNHFTGEGIIVIIPPWPQKQILWEVKEVKTVAKWLIRLIVDVLEC